MPFVCRKGNQGPRVAKGLTQGHEAGSWGGRPRTQAPSRTPERSPLGERLPTKAAAILQVLHLWRHHLLTGLKPAEGGLGSSLSQSLSWSDGNPQRRYLLAGGGSREKL